MLKKTTVYVMLGIFLFNTAGYFFTFKMAQYRVKKEVKRQLKLQVPESDLSVITIDKTKLQDIVWEENNNEFYHEGQMYDIVKSTEDASVITYYCINDEQEKKLFENLNDHIDRYISSNKTAKNQTSKKHIGPSFKLYYTSTTSFNCCFECVGIIQNVAAINYTHIYPEISVPPPEQA